MQTNPADEQNKNINGPRVNRISPVGKEKVYKVQVWLSTNINSLTTNAIPCNTVCEINGTLTATSHLVTTLIYEALQYAAFTTFVNSVDKKQQAELIW